MKQRSFLIWLLAGLLCAGLLLFPAGWAAADRQLLLQTNTPRPACKGLLTEQARSIPVLYGVHAADSLGQTALWEGLDTAAGLQSLRALARQLQGAGVLTSADCSALEDFAGQEEIQLQTAREDLFTGFQRTYSSPLPFRSLAWRVHTDSGLAVSVCLPLAAEQPAETMLAAYRAYLGLDLLPDWEAVELPAHLGAAQTSALWSAQGQAYLYCACDSRQTVFGLCAMSRDELEALVAAAQP